MIYPDTKAVSTSFFNIGSVADNDILKKSFLNLGTDSRSLICFNFPDLRNKVMFSRLLLIKPKLLRSS